MNCLEKTKINCGWDEERVRKMSETGVADLFVGVYSIPEKEKWRSFLVFFIALKFQELQAISKEISRKFLDMP